MIVRAGAGSARDTDYARTKPPIPYRNSMVSLTIHFFAIVD